MGGEVTRSPRKANDPDVLQLRQPQADAQNLTVNTVDTVQ